MHEQNTRNRSTKQCSVSKLVRHTSHPVTNTPSPSASLRSFPCHSFLTRGMGNMCGIPTSNTYPWPSCETHYELATEYNDFYSYVWESLYDPHGPVHIWIGGVLDCEEAYKKIGELTDEDTAGQLAMFSFVHRKNLYREGFFSCDGTASIDQKPEDVRANRGSRGRGTGGGGESTLIQPFVPM